ncbi:Trp biosynthesis-associated membrane protein [Canibacter zhoujuaniae]|uniref:Trp biosynthesis-associated membrane protein n=1 Tax=Canibacter zhoujuaniae TaxID=2708343 RepID=UPI0014219B99|nr:Trp biosynthesis-associated membrane protein [Canibacter zhoujuaniae]
MRKITELKTVVIVALFGAALLLVSLSQVWFNFKLQPGVAVVDEFTVTGAETTASLIAATLAAIAATLALPALNRVLRYLCLTVTGLAAIACLYIVTTFVIMPVTAGGKQLAELTGITGEGATYAVTEIATSGVVALTYVGAALLVLATVLGLAGNRRWQSGRSKYDTVADSKKRREAATVQSEKRGRSDNPVSSDDRISDWDAISDGHDPSL